MSVIVINNLLAAYEQSQRNEDARFAAAPKDRHAEIMNAVSAQIQIQAHEQYYVGALRILLTNNINPDDTNLRDYDITREGDELIGSDGEHIADYGDANGYDDWKPDE